MPRDILHYLRDMADAIAKIERYTSGVDYGAFCENGMLVDAVVRNLEIIGEAAKNVPADVRDRHPGIEWKKVGAFRDILAHSYFGVDLEIVWDIVKRKLPPLGEEVARILAEMDGE